METAASKVERIVQRFEARANAARQLQAIIREFPELLHDLCDPDVSEARNGARPVASTPTAENKSGRGRTAFQRVAAIFLANNNEWVDTSVLTQLSGVSRNVA